MTNAVLAKPEQQYNKKNKKVAEVIRYKWTIPHTVVSTRAEYETSFHKADGVFNYLAQKHVRSCYLRGQQTHKGINPIFLEMFVVFCFFK